MFSFLARKKKITLRKYREFESRVRDTSLLSSMLLLNKIKDSVNGNKFYLITFWNNRNKSYFSKAVQGNLAENVHWLTTVQPTIVFINAIDITEEQYIAFEVKQAMEDRMRFNGYEIQHIGLKI